MKFRAIDSSNKIELDTRNLIPLGEKLHDGSAEYRPGRADVHSPLMLLAPGRWTESLMKKDAKLARRGARASASKQGTRSKALRGWVTTVLGAIGLLYNRTGSLAVAIIGAAVALLATALFLAFARKS